MVYANDNYTMPNEVADLQLSELEEKLARRARYVHNHSDVMKVLEEREILRNALIRFKNGEDDVWIAEEALALTASIFDNF